MKAVKKYTNQLFKFGYYYRKYATCQQYIWIFQFSKTRYYSIVNSLPRLHNIYIFLFFLFQVLHKLSNQDMIHCSISAFRFLLKPTQIYYCRVFVGNLSKSYSSLPPFFFLKKMAPIFQTNPFDHIQIILWDSHSALKFWKKLQFFNLQALAEEINHSMCSKINY